MTTEIIEKNLKGLGEVRGQYEDYPYPYRNPEDEHQRLLVGEGDNLNEINHWLFKGKETFNDGFRILVAGGGTGDASTYYSHQLKGKNAEIVYLDFSKASMEIAKRRAEIRGATNARFIHDSILNIPNLNLGKFDLINCYGCLHHLESPDEGLKILRNSLKDTGGMHLMVYGKYGRTGVYHMQEIMRRVNKGIDNRVQEVANAKIILNNVPQTNWFARGRELVSDHINFGDIGIYDLFLHKQDRAYSIPELFEYITKQDLNFVAFSDIRERISLKIENFIKDVTLLQRLKTLPLEEQYAISELLLGNQIKHSFYVSAQKNSAAIFEDMDNIPYFFTIPADYGHAICQMIKDNKISIGQTVTLEIDSNKRIKNTKISFIVTQLTISLFANITPEQKTFGEILGNIQREYATITQERFIQEIKRVLTPFVDTSLMLIKGKGAGL
jgi:SAM-dependent methyltransferase